MEGKWSILICTGWNGHDQASRRLGVGAGFDLMHRAAASLHTAILTDASGNRLPQVQVEGLGVETDSALDLANLWVGSIAVSVELPLELLEGDACYGPLDDYLKTAATFDIPDGHEFDPDTEEIGVDGDLASRFDQPQ